MMIQSTYNILTITIFKYFSIAKLSFISSKPIYLNLNFLWLYLLALLNFTVPCDPVHAIL